MKLLAGHFIAGLVEPYTDLLSSAIDLVHSSAFLSSQVTQIYE